MKIKKLLSLALTMGIGASVVSVGAITASAESVSGGWNFSDVAAVNVTEEEKAALAEAIENGYDGVSTFEATDVVASQVVSGSNYAFLCKETQPDQEAPSNWSIVTVFIDTDGSSSLKRIETIDTSDIRTTDELPEEMVGAWSVNGKETGVEVSSAVQSALSNNIGLSLVPTAVLAEQVVAGYNYRILAYGTLVTENPRTDLYVVDVYEGLDGTAEIKNITTFDILAYCTTEETEDPGETDPTEPVSPIAISGGWNFSDIAADNAPADAQSILDKALEISYNGVSKFEVTDVIATQVVSGTNYAYLCKETPADKDAPTNWSIITLFSDFSGNTSLVHIESIDPTNIKTLDNIPDAPLAGAWTADGKEKGADLPEAVQAALDSNMGLSLVPTAVLAEQVVAGINYRILAYGTLVTAEPRTDLYIVDVFADLEGTAKITSISAFDITAYCSANTTDDETPDEPSAETPDEPSAETPDEPSPVPSDKPSSDSTDRASDKSSDTSSTSSGTSQTSTAPATGDSTFAIVLVLLSVLAVSAVISVKTVRSRKKDR